MAAPFSVRDEKTYSIFYNVFKRAFALSLNLNSTSTHIRAATGHDLNSSPNEDDDDYDSPNQIIFKFIVEGLGITLITTAGVIGNIVTVFVLTKKKMYTKSINLLLLGLAIADTIFISSTLLASGIPSICIYMNFDVTQSYLGLFLPYGLPVVFSALLMSVYFTIAVTVERYLVVAHPLRSRSYCTPQNAKCCAASIVLFAWAYNLPRWFEYTSVSVTSHVDSTVRYLTVTTELRRNLAYDRYYILFGYSTVAFVLPIIILIVLNLLIYRNVRLANHNRKSLSKTQKVENSLAFMLLIVVTMFICCNSFSVLDALVKFVMGSRSLGLESIRNFFVIFNSCVNFFIYFAYGETFRSLFLEMLPGWVRRRCCCCITVNSRGSGPTGSIASSIHHVIDRNDSLMSFARPSELEMNCRNIAIEMNAAG